jgi:hypothetical protein
MSDYRFVYKGYTDLSWYELVAIADYMNLNDSEALVSIIKYDNPSPDMRHFIADIVTKKLTRPVNKKSSVFKRNYEIYKQIGSLLNEDPKLKLTSSASKDGAALIVSKRLGLCKNEDDDETAKKAYIKIKKLVENSSPDFEKIQDVVNASTIAYSIVLEVLREK